jgi:hypothetical protein
VVHHKSEKLNRAKARAKAKRLLAFFKLIISMCENADVAIANNVHIKLKSYLNDAYIAIYCKKLRTHTPQAPLAQNARALDTTILPPPGFNELDCHFIARFTNN